ncbi:hypothetical protein SAMN04488026_10054 [Aliiruegeria lutimaris]|uniref:Uncharacterized protein n=1 Tax=Aliiruegeria lutimaris TaxID=571298 RepID=A0A1G8M296_9RHOB|nr:hypothetical protein SAMN04488026_10054 [Aliiruegeria lutimaris]
MTFPERLICKEVSICGELLLKRAMTFGIWLDQMVGR